MHLPTIETTSHALNIPVSMAEELMSSYKQKDRELHLDLQDMFEGFDLSDHAVLWWSILLHQLQFNREASWTVLEYIAKEIPTITALQLLNQFRFDLIRYDTEKLNKVCRQIVRGSQYPMHAALRISGFMQMSGSEDLSRESQYLDLATDYSHLALHLLNKMCPDSDHMAAILLELPSDIEGGKSALDLAIEYRIMSFVNDNRVQRINISFFQQWRALHPKNRENTFKGTPLTYKTNFFFFKKKKKGPNIGGDFEGGIFILLLWDDFQRNVCCTYYIWYCLGLCLLRTGTYLPPFRRGSLPFGVAIWALSWPKFLKLMHWYTF
ncbi:hypothetical protein RFI_27083 [Reticulomyxa filosa]|uniref:Uncharacterized protein n=1 Tax=Reticulomyxa filosa TaxID=46433 RepID=X6MB85_RETFI|nr:hypothetical protein RFI_27083 [Reticulomyxa filosa]|eukprot:ETO10295.1 hypothetical protein RFI_27083 [Reticulomyxa filosa]